jgi:hypothetical protein
MAVSWLTGTYYPEKEKCSKCGNCGAVVIWRDMKQHEAFHATFSNRIGQDMSKVLWCDPGNHAFKAGSPGSVNFQGTQIDEDGMTRTVDTDACAEHNPYAPQNLKDDSIRRRLTAEAEHELRESSPEI